MFLMQERNKGIFKLALVKLATVIDLYLGYF